MPGSSRTRRAGGASEQHLHPARVARGGGEHRGGGIKQSEHREPRDASRVRILLVEDNPGDADLVRDAFAQAKADVDLVHVERLSHALEAASKGAFDLVLLDLSLPDAFELTGVSSVRMKFPNLPVVVLTALDDERLAAKAVAEGAQDYLIKGDLPAPLLVRAVRYAIEREQYTHRAQLLAAEHAGRMAAEELASENARLYQEAQRAIAARDEFLAIASHELRSPLAAHNLQLHVVEKGASKLAAPDLLRKVEAAIHSGKRLTSLVETLLDVSRITAGRFTLHKEPFDAVALVRDVVEQFQEIAERAGCEVSLQTDVRVEGQWDKVRVGQAVTNLLSNAIRYAPGPITVSVHEELAFLVMTVSDLGPGIPDPDLSRIFDRYQRAMIAREHRAGLGLGLFVSREIAIAHGGTLSAENLPERGARFTLRLPMQDSR